MQSPCTFAKKTTTTSTQTGFILHQPTGKHGHLLHLILTSLNSFFFFFQYTLVIVLFSLCMCPAAALIMQFNPFLDAWRLQKPSHRVNLAQSNGSLCPLIPDPEIGDIASRKPSFQMEVRLYGLKAAAWLQVAADGTVNGTLNTTSEFGRKVIYNPTLMTSW